MLHIRTMNRLIEWMFDRFELANPRNCMPAYLKENWDEIRDAIARGKEPDCSFRFEELEELDLHPLGTFLIGAASALQGRPEDVQIRVVWQGIRYLGLHSQFDLDSGCDGPYLYAENEKELGAWIAVPLLAPNK